jgi:uncharacterized protein (DUF1697 family)
LATLVALLRAVNVGGTAILPMKELADLCTVIGLGSVRTYIQSGNVVFDSDDAASEIQDRLERSLAQKMGQRIKVMVRTAAELRSVVEGNPFSAAIPARVIVMFLPEPALVGLLDNLFIPGAEEVRPSGREIYVHYPDGIGRSKLKFPQTLTATGRNLNTVAKLAVMAGG